MFEKVIGGQVVRLYNTKETAALLEVNPSTVLRYLHRGRLCGTKFRWSYYFSESEILRFLTEPPPRMNDNDYRRSRAERQSRKDAPRRNWENTESLF